jgi:hypothetical protein
MYCFHLHGGNVNEVTSRDQAVNLAAFEVVIDLLFVSEGAGSMSETSWTVICNPKTLRFISCEKEFGVATG